MKRLYLNANKKLELRKVINVTQLPNEQDWSFTVERGRWHSHDKFKTFCGRNCLVMAVF